MSSGKMLTCANCGNDEPEGSQFCGNCGASFAAPAPEPEATPADAHPPPSSGGGRHRLRWFAIGAVLALLLVGGAVAAVLLLERDSNEDTVASSGETVSSESDCAALNPVITHFGLAADQSVSDGWIVYPYEEDLDFLEDYAGRAPEAVRADVLRLRDFLDRYAEAAQAVGLESRTIPDTDQQQEIAAALNLSSDEEDDLRGSIQLLLAFGLAGCSSDGGAVAGTTTSGDQTVSAEDCATLGSVVGDFTVGANAGDLVPNALDITAGDYLVDRDFLESFSDRAPAEIQADVLRLALWTDRYATAMQAAGLEPGTLPTGDQAGEIRAASQIGSIEQDQLPGSIEALAAWAASGCSGGRPATTDSSGSLATEPAPVEPNDEDVTLLINEAMSQRTEWELGNAPLGSEVRDCRKDYDVSSTSLLAPGGVAYVCEVWFEGELWSDAGFAALDADGSVYVAP